MIDPDPSTTAPATLDPEWSELVDDDRGILLRRVVVGPLRTNCYVITSIPGQQSIVVDPGDDAAAILDAVADVDVGLIVLTHAHFDHVQALAEVAETLGAPIAAHPDDAPVWPHELDHLHRYGHFDAGTATADLLAAGCSLCPPPAQPPWDGRVDRLLRHGDVINVDRLAIATLHTPGHTPGGLSLHLPGQVLTGDTLFPGGPGLTGWPLSDFTTILESIEHILLTLPPATIVHPGHGHPTTISTELPHLTGWAARGW
ncbi:MAG: MBL fold metallo-hydrolase [Actinomycetota bacterium]|nr:MBL fold metallo-hydrolase [Actinomycetota bacterium]